MEAIRLDVVIDPNGEAARAAERFSEALKRAGFSADEAARHVQDFEEEYLKAAQIAQKASKDIEQSHGGAGGAARQQSLDLNALSGAIIRYAGPAVVVGAAKATVGWADSIAELAERTKFSTTAVQQMGKVADQNGSSFTALAGAVQIAEQRLADGNKKAMAAVAEMGLSASQLLAEKPEDRLRDLAKGLADIEDPAKRSSAEMAVFGRSADALAPTLNQIAEGADKAKSALGPDWIRAGGDAADQIDDITDSAMDLVRAFFLWPVALENAAKAWNEASFLGTALQMATGTNPAMPTLPGSPTVLPKPLPEGGDPFAHGGIGGNSWEFINRILKPKFETDAQRKTREAAELKAWWARFDARRDLMYGSVMQNPSGWRIPRADFGLVNEMTPSLLGLGHDANSVLAPFSAATMKGPNWQPYPDSTWSKITGFASSKWGQMTAGGIGLLTNLFGGKLGLNQTGQGIGSMIGSFIPGLGPLGSALGGLAGGLFGKLFGGGEGRKVNDMRDEFTAKYGGTQELAKLAQEAGTNLDAFFKAKNVKDYQKAIEDLTKKFDALADKKAKIADLEDQLAQLKDASEVTFDDMQSVVNDFGLDIAKLGPAFQQAAMDKEAKRIIDAFEIMKKGGADMNGVLDGMKDEISKLVTDSIKFGTTIPENMRPWIEELMKTHKLTDENGKEITDLSQLKFGDPIASELEKVAKKMSELIDKLDKIISGTDKMADGFDRAADAAGDLDRALPGRSDYNDGFPGDGGAVPVARGGLMLGPGRVQYFGRGGFVPMGTDVIPAMLTPGEMVTSAGATKQILDALRRPQSSAITLVPIFVDGRQSDRAVIDEVYRQFPRRIAGNDGQSRAALVKVLSDWRRAN